MYESPPSFYTFVKSLLVLSSSNQLYLVSKMFTQKLGDDVIVLHKLLLVYKACLYWNKAAV